LPPDPQDILEQMKQKCRPAPNQRGRETSPVAVIGVPPCTAMSDWGIKVKIPFHLFQKILGGEAAGRGGRRPPYSCGRNNSRLMIWRWISLVPSQIRSTRASRQIRSKRQFIHQPHAAMDLDRLIRDHGQHFGRLEFGHGHIGIASRSLHPISSPPPMSEVLLLSAPVAISASLKLTP
jgi:hypothetical protein